MAVTQTQRRRGDPTLEVTCDRCAATLAVPVRDPATWSRLWLHAVGIGWRGPSHPIGPHTCETCSGRR